MWINHTESCTCSPKALLFKLFMAPSCIGKLVKAPYGCMQLLSTEKGQGLFACKKRRYSAPIYNVNLALESVVIFGD